MCEMMHLHVRIQISLVPTFSVLHADIEDVGVAWGRGYVQIADTSI